MFRNPRQRPVRVCFISPGASGFFQEGSACSHGGAELQMFLYAGALAQTGKYEVLFIAHGESDIPPVEKNGVRALFCPFKPGMMAKAQFQKTLALANADVYIQSGTGSVTKEVAFFKNWRRRRFIYWIASDFDVDPTIGNTGLDRNQWFEWGMLSADAIVAQTERQARELSSRYGRNGAIIPNAFPEIPAWAEATEKRHVLWIGRYTPVKRPELFATLAESLPEYPFLLVGPTIKGESMEYFRRQVPMLEKVKNLTYHPGVPFHATYTFFDQALALVNTSVSEGYPNTFVQAMQTRTPIASLRFDPDGIIARHGLGVAPTGDDLTAFIDQLRALLEDADRRWMCGERARQYFEDHHLLESNVTILEALINRLDLPGRH